MNKKTIGYISAIIILILTGIIPFVTVSSLMDVALLSKFLVIAGLLLVFFLFEIVKKTESITFNIIDFAFLLFASWQVASILWAHNFSEAIFSAATVLLFFFSYLSIKLILIDYRDFGKWLVPIIAISSFTLTLYGWYEFFSIDSFHHTNDVYTIDGFSAHKNLFSAQLFVLLPFLCIGFFNTESKLKWLYALAISSQLLLLFSLLSRAFLVGFIGTLLLAGILFFVKRSQGTHILKPALVLISGVVIFVFVIYSLTGGTELLQRYNFKNFSKTRNAKERIQIWKNTIELIKDRPLLGYGAGNWDIFFPSKGINKIPRMAIRNETIARPHNDYLWITAESGIIGLLMYSGLLVLIYFYTFKSIKQSINRSATLKLILLISFFTGYLIIAFFDFPKERPELNFFIALTIASLTHSIHKQVSFKKILTIRNFGNKLWMAGTLILLSGIFYVGIIRFKKEQQVKIIKTMFQTNKWDKVIRLSQNIKHPLYTIDPTELPIDYNICYAYFNKKNYTKTIEYGKYAIEDSPYHQSSLLQIATAYAELKNFDMGAAYYERALQMHPTNNRILESLAICYYNSNQHEAAKEVLKRVKSNHPSIKKMRKVFDL